MLIVTGGAGFIGSVLVAALNEAGHDDIVIVDRLGSDERWRNIAKRDFHEIVAIDALQNWLSRRGDEVEAIFHLGANSSTFATDADEIVATNLNYTIALWRWCTAAGRPLIYASSAATYGDGLAGFDDACDLQSLKRLRPLNLYGWSKHAFDQWAAREAARGKAPPRWIGLKFFNVFGPNEYHKGEMQSLVAKNYRRVMDGGPIRLFKSYRPDFADGAQLRDFVYVKDCVAAALRLWRHGDGSGLFNIGSGTVRSFRDLMLALGDACGKPANIEYVDMPEAMRPNYQYFTEAPIDRLRLAGYDAPFLSLEAAVRDFVTGYLSQPDRYL
ncbi:MAG TPA: ADP-glyceromanno-heptose 6-epimerase [Stellaceae bacterium]|jgi:ADP-L-glycero-D-manno-heptose 6-epimerase